MGLGWGRVRWGMGSLDWPSLSALHNMMVWAGISAQLFSSWVGGASAWALTSEAACVYRERALALPKAPSGRQGGAEVTGGKQAWQTLGHGTLGGPHAEGLAIGQEGRRVSVSDGEKAAHWGGPAVAPDCIFPAFCVSALVADCELFPFCLCLLSLRSTLLPAVPGSFPWSGPAAL